MVLQLLDGVGVELLLSFTQFAIDSTSVALGMRLRRTDVSRRVWSRRLGIKRHEHPQVGGQRGLLRNSAPINPGCLPPYEV